MWLAKLTLKDAYNGIRGHDSQMGKKVRGLTTSSELPSIVMACQESRRPASMANPARRDTR